MLTNIETIEFRNYLYTNFHNLNQAIIDEYVEKYNTRNAKAACVPLEIIVPYDLINFIKNELINNNFNSTCASLLLKSPLKIGHIITIKQFIYIINNIKDVKNIKNENIRIILLTHQIENIKYIFYKVSLLYTYLDLPNENIINIHSTKQQYYNLEIPNYNIDKYDFKNDLILNDVFQSIFNYVLFIIILWFLFTLYEVL